MMVRMVFEFEASDYTEAYTEFTTLVKASNKEYEKVSLRVDKSWQEKHSIQQL